ncbi:hypothetical protein HDU91_004280 [Kappamyces sp. JEL0680]|nr:hypothetical protein HDU91_004280 [Kappamyces sp. JEL0680]
MEPTRRSDIIKTSEPMSKKGLNRQSVITTGELRGDVLARLMRNYQKDSEPSASPVSIEENYIIPESKEEAKRQIVSLFDKGWDFPKIFDADFLPPHKQVSSPKTNAAHSSEKLDWKDNQKDPAAYGKSLFEECIPNFTRSMVAPIIGKGRLCIQLHLTGETQAIDRILFQVAAQYWNCNPGLHHVYKSIGLLLWSNHADVVYGTLFSIVLLNTDLNTVNIGTKSNKKMPLKVFLKNTMSLMDNMIGKDASLQQEVTNNPDALKNWKRDYENLLKDVYNSVKDHPIIQNTPSRLRSTSSPVATPPQTTAAPRSSPFGFLRKGKSSTALNDSQARDSVSPSSQPTLPAFQIVLEGALIRKHVLADDGERAGSRRWAKFWCGIRIQKETGVELLMHKLSYQYTADKEFTDAEFDESLVHYEGLQTYPSILASPDSERASPLCEAPAGTPNNQSFQLAVGKRYLSAEQNPDSPKLPHPVISSPSQEYKLANQEPEVFPLIHSFATTHYYGPQREQCFSLHMANNHVYLFQAPTEQALQAWITTINYWAARKSREPMRGSVGNVEYGWTIGSQAGLTPDPPRQSGSIDSSLATRDKSNDSSVAFESNSSPNKNAMIKIDFANAFGVGAFGSPSSSKPDKRKIKIAKWVEASVSTRLLSSKNDLEQLQSMNKQLDLVRAEIEDHETHREPMEDTVSLLDANCRQLYDHPQYQQAMANWNRKADSLFKEYAKYELYCQTLQSSLLDDQITISATSPLPSPLIPSPNIDLFKNVGVTSVTND